MSFWKKLFGGSAGPGMPTEEGIDQRNKEIEEDKEKRAASDEWAKRTQEQLGTDQKASMQAFLQMLQGIPAQRNRAGADANSALKMFRGQAASLRGIAGQGGMEGAPRASRVQAAMMPAFASHAQELEDTNRSQYSDVLRRLKAESALLGEQDNLNRAFETTRYDADYKRRAMELGDRLAALAAASQARSGAGMAAGGAATDLLDFLKSKGIFDVTTDA